MAVSTDEQFRMVARELEDIARKRLGQEYLEKQERRAAQRTPFHQVMRLADEGEARASTEWTWRPMLSLDVSRDGLGLVSPTNALQIGTSVLVNCLPGHMEPMSMPGRVVRVDEVFPGMYATGIQFQFCSALLEAAHGRVVRGRDTE